MLNVSRVTSIILHSKLNFSHDMLIIQKIVNKQILIMHQQLICMSIYYHTATNT